MKEEQTRSREAAVPKPMSKTRMLATGAGLMLAGLALAYFALIRHVQQAQQTGELEYSIKALLAVPLLFYSGLVLILLTFTGDRSTRNVDASGRRSVNVTGWVFLLSVVGSLVLMIASWVHYVHQAGFQAF